MTKGAVLLAATALLVGLGAGFGGGYGIWGKQSEPGGYGERKVASAGVSCLLAVVTLPHSQHTQLPPYATLLQTQSPGCL
jgi:hypothetical protein